jgi:phosphatidate cytidylyltransferase
MLKQRIITALVLLGFLFPAFFHPDIFWTALAGLVLIGAAAWEWGRLNSLSRYRALWITAACAIFCCSVWQLNLLIYFDRVFWLMVGAVWVLLGAYLLAGGVARWNRIPALLRCAGGSMALCFTWLALVACKTSGIDFLLSVLLLVWMADIAAYFSGKAWGQHKLASEISPGKTWEGVGGAMLGVFFMGFSWLAVVEYFSFPSQSLFDRLYAHGFVVFILGLIFLVMMSVVGDLVESLVKRSAGAKDSSQLLPGHGGILDRIDALLPTLPLAVMLALL